MPATFLTPVNVTPASTGVFVEVDISSYVSPDATGAIIRVVNRSTRSRRLALRKKGSSDNFNEDLDRECQTWDFVGIDAAGRFEAKIETSLITLELTGYFEGEAVFPTTAIDITPIASGSYQTIDVAPHSGAAKATAAILLFAGGSGAEVFARKKGSSDDYRARIESRQPFVVGLDANERAEVFVSSLAASVRLIGYFVGGVDFPDNAIDITPSTSEAWEASALPAGASGAFVWIDDGSSSFTFNQFGVRAAGSGLAWNDYPSERASYAAVAGAPEIEAFSEDRAKLKLYRTGVMLDALAIVAGARGTRQAQRSTRSFAVAGPAVIARGTRQAQRSGRVWARNTSVVVSRGTHQAQRGDATATRVGAGGLGERILALVARPYDESIPTTAKGAPAPFGVAPFGGGLDFIVKGSTTAVYFAESTFDSRPSDTPANTPFHARLSNAFAFEQSLFAGAEPAGRSTAGAGDIRIINSNGRFDGLLDLGWSGRAVDLYRGYKGQAFADFVRVFAGTCDGLAWDEVSILVKLRDLQTVLDQPMQASFYSGAGGMAGSALVEGKPRPQAYGECLNISPVQIDPTFLVYQFHDRQAEAVLEVRDNGAALTAGGDISSLALASLYDWAPGGGDAGSFITDLSRGAIRLASSPAGEVTADVKGDAAGGYVSTTAGIARRIVTTRAISGGPADPEGLDVASFEALEMAQPATVQFYASAEEQPAIAEVLDQLLAGIGGFWVFGRLGRLTVGRLEAPAEGGPVITKREIAESKPLQREILQRPSRARRVAHSRLWTVQDAGNLAGSLNDEQRAFYSTGQRYAVASDASVLTKHRLALDIETPGLFVNSAAAQTEAERLLALHGVPRSVYTLGVVEGLFRFELGQSVTLQLGRFGLDSGRPFVVTRFVEDAVENSILLELWG